MTTPNGLHPTGFFVLRTPLLPFAAMPSSRESLRQSIAIPAVQEALYVASPDLCDSLKWWLDAPDSERGLRVQRALVRYFSRLVARATPFGFFAGFSIGTMQSSRTRLRLPGREFCRRQTTIDADVLNTIVAHIERENAPALTYRANETAYRVADKIRFVETRSGGLIRTHDLTEVDALPELQEILAKARRGCTRHDLIGHLVCNGADPAEAGSFVDEVIEAQLLVCNLQPAVSGIDPATDLISQLRDATPGSDLLRALESTTAQLKSLDERGLGVAPLEYAVALRELKALALFSKETVPRKHWVHAQLSRPSEDLNLSDAIGRDVAEAILLLQTITPKTSHTLMKFCDHFTARFGDQEVGLLYALDEDVGVGSFFSRRNVADPLLEGLPLYALEAGGPSSFTPREEVLLSLLISAEKNGLHQIELTKRDIETLQTRDPDTLPDALSAFIRIEATSEQSMNERCYQFYVADAGGPSGVATLGRFCHGDSDLAARIREHIGKEESLSPSAIFAEVVHPASGRLGNIVARPSLRRYELRILASGNRGSGDLIDLDDLFISVRRNEILLRSRKLNRRIIPRMTTAHNFIAWSSIPVYTFLGLLQTFGTAPSVKFDWGALSSADHLPRLVHGKLVLHLETWKLDEAALVAFQHLRPADLETQISIVRKRFGLPRYVHIEDDNKSLFVDFENVLCQEMFATHVKQRSNVILVEAFPNPDISGVEGPEGRFGHEIIVPLVRVREPASDPIFPAATNHQIERSLVPGSECIYAKLYTGYTLIDATLERLLPFVRSEVDGQLADKWFFIRYADPQPHLRIRFLGDRQRLWNELRPKLTRVLEMAVKDGLIWRIQFDTYEREIERYGGPYTLPIAESIFHIDSLSVVEMLEPIRSDAQLRWQIALLGFHHFFEMFDVPVEKRVAIARRSKMQLAKEFRIPSSSLWRRAGQKFRVVQRRLEDLLGPQHQLPTSIESVIRRRYERLLPLCVDMGRPLSGQARLEVVGSLCHMHANRIFVSRARENEMMIYDYLARLYESKLARSR